MRLPALCCFVCLVVPRPCESFLVSATALRRSVSFAAETAPATKTQTHVQRQRARAYACRAQRHRGRLLAHPEAASTSEQQSAAVTEAAATPRPMYRRFLGTALQRIEAAMPIQQQPV